MKLFRTLATLGLLAILFGSVMVSNSASDLALANTTYFKSCNQLRQIYKNGVSASSKSVNLGAGPIGRPSVNAAAYRKNSKLDIDKDGIACEVVLKGSSAAGGTNTSTPQPTAANPTPEAYFADTAQTISRPLSACQLKETSNLSGAGSKGFPARKSVASVGTIKVAIIPVDFENAAGTGIPRSLFSDDVEKIKEWAPYFSRGKLNYQVEFHGDKWVRAPKGAQWYVCVECQKGATQQLQSREAGIQELVTAADATYDFAGTELVYFIFPEAAEKEFGTMAWGNRVPLISTEGRFTASVYGEMGAGVGASADRTKIWDHAIHEFLHIQGFIGHGPENGSPYYITTNQWGISKSVTSWEGFLNGWFDENEVLCLDRSDIKGDFYLTMSSIDDFGPHKESLMIRLSDEELLVVELRAPGPFTETCTTCRFAAISGFSAYRVNVNLPQYRDDRDPAAESKNFWSYLRENGRAAMSKGLEYAGVRLTPISAKQIKISPAS